jgi:hypothetical protein
MCLYIILFPFKLIILYFLNIKNGLLAVDLDVDVLKNAYEENFSNIIQTYESKLLESKMGLR